MEHHMRMVRSLVLLLAVLVACAVLALPRLAMAQASPGIPPAITTPDKVESRIGTLDFKDGAPSKATLDKVYDNLDFTHAFNAFNNTMRGVSIAALHKGFQSIGVKDNEVLIFSELMDAKSLFLTANADTIYFLGVLVVCPRIIYTDVGDCICKRVEGDTLVRV
jgi:hypothetical protein